MRWLLGALFMAAWRRRDWLDTQAVPFPGEADRRCDTVAAFDRRAGDHRPLAVVIEFMSQVRHDTLRRLLHYCLQVQEDCPYATEPRVEYSVVGVVVNLTGGAQAGALTDRPPDVGDLGLQATFGVRTLKTHSAAALLEEVAAGAQSRTMLVWCPLMCDADDPALIARWRTAVEQIADQSKRSSVAGLALVFAELADREAIWKRGLEGFDMERSRVIMEWEQRGEKRGAVRGQQELLLAVLKARFPKDLPDEARTAVEAQQDVATLTAWSAAAATAGSWAEVREAWGLNGH